MVIPANPTVIPAKAGIHNPGGNGASTRSPFILSWSTDGRAGPQTAIGLAEGQAWFPLSRE